MSGRPLCKVPWFTALVQILRKGGTLVSAKDVMKLIAKLEYPLALHLEIYAFVATAELTPSRIALREKSIAALQAAVCKELPKTRLLVHGSHATGLAHNFSDVNLLAKKIDDTPVSRTLICQILQRSFSTPSMKITCTQQYMPSHSVVQVEDLENNLIVRISVIDDYFLRKAKWVNNVLHNLPEVRPLYMITSALMISADYLDPECGGAIIYRSRLSSWLLMCLVVAFCRRCRETCTVRSLLGDILIAFLHTYTNFKYNELIIDPNSKTGSTPRTRPHLESPLHVLDPVTHVAVEHDIRGCDGLVHFRAYLDALLKMLIDTRVVPLKPPRSILAPALSMEVWDPPTGKIRQTPLDNSGYAIFRPFGVANSPNEYS